MNERDNFIVEDLDDFHIIIKADEEYRVRKQLELEVHRSNRAFCRMGLIFLSVGEEHVQFGMICLLPNSMTKNVYTLRTQARSHIHVPLQLPGYPGGELESRQRPSERPNNLFYSIPQS
jgi:TFIIH basal transcription factor complex TTD-A subunit